MAREPAPADQLNRYRLERHQLPALHVSAARLIGSAVYGPEMRRIGTVRDILFRENGQASAILVSSSFRWGRALPRYYRAPWSALEFGAGIMGVQSTVPSGELDAYGWGEHRDAVRRNETRVRVVLRSKVLLENRTRYGNVRDIVFDTAGRLQGLVIVPLAKLGDTRGQREPHIYSSAFDVESARRRITLPYASKNEVREEEVQSTTVTP